MSSIAPIELMDLHDLREPDVLEALGALGKGAFAETDEELDSRQYVFPELIRAGMFEAAAAAADVGFSTWARDGEYDSAADILARKRDADRLVWLLERFPLPQTNLWRDRGADKLWMICAEKRLFGAFPALAQALGAPTERAWREAFPSTSFPGVRWGWPSLDLAAKLSHFPFEPNSAPTWLAGAFGVFASFPEMGASLSRLTAPPGFDASRFISPWEEAASARKADSMRALLAQGVDVQGWRPRADGETAWGCLARAGGDPAGCAASLEAAGLRATSKDLAAALVAGLDDLADAMERAGAKPEASMGSFCLEKLDEKDKPHGSRLPNPRLRRWLSQGYLDFASVLRMGAERGFGKRSWAAEALAAVADRAQADPDLAREITDALVGAPSWDPSDPAQRKLFFSKWDSQGVAGSLARIARALGAPKDPAGADRVDEALAAWWEAQGLRSLAARPGSKAPRALTRL